MSLYVETVISTTLDDRRLQSPPTFCLPIVDLCVTTGTSVSTQTRRPSTVTFRSTGPFSLISDGAGYYLTLPAPHGVRLLARYDYRTRFGALGATLDSLFFRPVLAWATAWNVDALRLWLERGQTPRRTLVTTFLLLALWGLLVGAWILWLAAPERATLLWLLSGTLAVFAIHFVSLPFLPSTSRCRWSWK